MPLVCLKPDGVLHRTVIILLIVTDEPIKVQIERRDRSAKFLQLI